MAGVEIVLATGTWSMADSMERCYEKSPNVVYREIAEERILVPIKKNTADMAAIYVLNETGARVWDLLDGDRTVADIRDVMAAEYEVEEEVLVEDLATILGQLEETGMVKVCDGSV